MNELMRRNALAQQRQGGLIQGKIAKYLQGAHMP
jgi:hypothetical protein